jgi:predicted phosphodiesterase
MRRRSCRGNSLRAVRRIAAVALIALAACFTIPDWREPVAQRLLTGPYILLTGPDSALIGFSVSNVATATVWWESEDGAGGEAIARRSGNLFSAKLEKLPRGPQIKYKVRLAKDKDFVAEGKFRVGRGPTDRNTRFAAFGDTRTNHRIHREVAMAVAREDIDFLLHTGDMVERGGKPEQWITFFQIERELLAKTPIIPAIGNHDVSGRGYFERYFFLDQWAGGNRYFVTDWANVRLIAVDLGIECDERCSQYRFVERALEEGAEDGKILVLFLHYPPYSSGAHGSHLGVQPIVSDLARRYGIEVVVTGHDHNYERTKPINGTTYLVSGSAGAPIRPVQPQDFTAEARTEPHYVLFDVDGDKLSLRAINLRGEVFDEAVIEPNPRGGPPP